MESRGEFSPVQIMNDGELNYPCSLIIEICLSKIPFLKSQINTGPLLTRGLLPRSSWSGYCPYQPPATAGGSDYALSHGRVTAPINHPLPQVVLTAASLTVGLLPRYLHLLYPQSRQKSHPLACSSCPLHSGQMPIMEDMIAPVMPAAPTEC